MSDEVIFIRDKKIEVEIPNFSGELSRWYVVWAKHLKDNFYIMSLRNCKEKMYRAYIIAVFSDGRFVPHSPADSMSQEERIAYKYLVANGVIDASEKIYIARLEK